MNRLQLAIASSLGPLYLVASDEGLTGVYWDEQAVPHLKALTDRDLGHHPVISGPTANNLMPGAGADGSPHHSMVAARPAASHLMVAAEQIQAYLNGERKDFDLPLSMQGTAFQREVWSELRRIPYGQTISYSELANRVKRPKACRAVGSANGKNPLSLIIPCHRVIAANASLGGYSGGLDRKRWLLQLESL